MQVLVPKKNVHTIDHGSRSNTLGIFSKIGLPHPSTFPFYSLTAEIKGMGPEQSPVTTPVPVDLTTPQEQQKAVRGEVVTVPHGPQANKVESLSTSLQVRTVVQTNK